MLFKVIDSSSAKCLNGFQFSFYLLSGEIEMLKNQVFNQLGCGKSHSIALTDTGQLFSWGSDEFGQLGCGVHEEAYIIKPK